MKITNSSLSDLDLIYSLYKSAIEYQKKKGFELWPLFERQLIETDIKENRHFKILEGENIVCIFSIQYNDPVIWGERDKDPAIYLHRICVNPAFKGREIMKVIKDWAQVQAKQQNRKFLRMDTWGNNEKLREYYIRCGFTYIGQQNLKSTEGLPDHYGGNYLSLFENEVN
jgi:hypothetical protein